MIKQIKPKLWIVDDDLLFLKSLEVSFTQNSDFLVRPFISGEDCLSDFKNNLVLDNKPDVIILDYHLDSQNSNAMNGLEVLDRIKEIDPNLPVIILSSQDKIEVAVNCMKHKAFDYIVKSETAFIRLEKAIWGIFKNQRMEKELNWYMERM